MSSHTSSHNLDSRRLSQQAARLFVVATGLAVILTVLSWSHAFGSTNSSILIVLVCGVIILGLPHGALDPMVAQKWLIGINDTRTGDGNGTGKNRMPIFAFYVIYMLIALAYIGVWILTPTLGLVSFLLISAFHFGSDWADRGSVVTRFAYGLAVITLPATFHASGVSAIFSILGAHHVQALVSISAIVGPIAAAFAIIAALTRYRTHNTDFWEICAITLGALVLNPLVFFGLYFCLLHSPRHLFETSHDLGLTSWGEIARATAPIVLATLGTAVVALLLMPKVPVSHIALSLVFIGLAALTLPHMILEYITE